MGLDDGVKVNDYEKNAPQYTSDEDVQVGIVQDNADHLHRRLGNRQIQLIAIGGSIGTALFVSMGGALAKGGPGSLFLAYLIYSCIMALVNNSAAEMTILHPVSGGFVRQAGKWVDEAFGFAAGYNFFVYEGLCIPFEITALSLVVSFWSDNIPGYAVPIACIILWTIINLTAVKWYGEAEFWLSGGKVILVLLLFCFTFITMCGGNPQHDAYGFRYWKNPGAFAEHLHTGSLGKFEGFLACVWSASFVVVGPEYLSMVSGEAKRPRIYMKSAFKTVYARFALFFIGSALAIGIVVAYNDPTLVAILDGTSSGSGTATASPYVVAMNNMGITGLPHLVNALLCTSIFSAGNTYTYCATRTLYGLAIEGRAPKILRHCTKSGVPIYAFCFVLLFPMLSFLQLGKGSSVVLNWLLNLITGGGIIDFIVMTGTYCFYYKATQAQGIDRKKLPYYGYFQPYGNYIALGCLTAVLICYGYTSFTPWSVQDFFIYYAMHILFVVNFIGWKLIKRTKFVKSAEADLVWDRPIIDAYEETFYTEPVGFWREMIQLVGLKKVRGGNDQRRGSVVAKE